MSVLSMLAPPPARPRDPAAVEAPEPRRFSRELLELAVSQYEAAHRLEREAAKASRANPADSSLDRWVNVAGLGRSCAESALMAVILAHDPSVSESHLNACERLYHRGHGVRSGGRIYLVLPWPHFDPTDKPPGGSMMHLVVLDADAIDTPEVN